MQKTLVFLLTIITLFLLSGCATWDGLKQDTSEAYDATKDAIHEATE